MYRACLIIIVSFVLASFFSCSDSIFESSTDLGAPLLSSIDSSITDFDKNFKSVSIRTAVLDKYSKIDSTATLHGGRYTVQTILRAGPWWDERASAYMEFSSDSIMRLLSDTTIKIDSMRLHIVSETEFAQAATPTISLCYSDEKEDGSIFIPSQCDTAHDSVKMYTTEASSVHLYADIDAASISFLVDLLDSLQRYTINEVGTDTVIAAAGDTAFNPIYDTIYNKIAIGLTSDTLVAFSSHLASGSYPVLEIKYMQNDTSDTSAEIDTMRSNLQCMYSEHSIVSNNAIADSTLLSSAGTGRYSLFTLDLAPLWALLDDPANGWEYKNVLGIDVNVPIDTADIFSQNSILISYGLNNVLAGTINDVSLSSARLEKDTANALYPYSTDSLDLGNINALLQSRPSTGYLYLFMPRSNSSAKIYWQSIDSISINAILSNPQ